MTTPMTSVPSETASDHRGYEVGPTLAPEERPWPLGWETDPAVIECPHGDWELVLLAADGERRLRIEEVVRCIECHAPRCGHSTEEDPCDLVRHHDGPHFPRSAYPTLRPFEEDPVAIRFGFTRWQTARQPNNEREGDERS